jgi:NADH-quinone oxidoreductase subunit G
MTVITSTGTEPAGEPVPAADAVTVTIDGIEVAVPKGTLVIRAAELLGIAVPRFCDHPLLDPVGACRQCLVDVEGQRKPLASCTTTVTEGMVVRTQLTSPAADKAQRGVMEMLLVNHPLDCPICDKGGECPLQNQAMSNGRGESRFEGPKRTFPKPIALSTQVLLDRERCISCARCTRFAAQIAGDPFIELVERGSTQQVGIEASQPFNSYFSGNTVQICPVGALTGTAYRFRARPFDLVSTPTACEHCASGCALRTDHRRGTVLRRLAADDPQVNEEWNCDKGRWAFHSAGQPDRLRVPLVREADGTMVETSWPDALDIAASGLRAAVGGQGAGVLVGGRATVEDAYAYAKLARVSLRTNDVDFRARPHSGEEAEFLASQVAGRGVHDRQTPTYADLDHAPVVVLAGLEPEEESPIVFLRLRKAARRRLQVFAVAPFASRGLERMAGRLVQAAPGTEPQVLDALARSSDALDAVGKDAARLLREPGAVLLVGERLATVPGALSAASRLAESTGARLGWVPRRAGEPGSVQAGALPGLLPGGRPVSDAAARVDAGTVWGSAALPAEPGRDAAAMLAAASAGQLGALVVGGVEVDDLADPSAALQALAAVPFLVSLEVRASAVTALADVVFPVAPVSDKPGTFLSWEGRPRRFAAVLRKSSAMSDTQVLSMLADSLGTPIGLATPAAAARELAELGPWTGQRAPAPAHSAAPVTAPGAGEAVLSTWRMLLDAGRMQDGEPHLAGTAHPAVARLSAATAAEVGVADGGLLGVSTDRGSVTVPLVVTQMPDRVVWLPTNSAGCAVRRDLVADSGAVVRLSPGGAE